MQSMQIRRDKASKSNFKTLLLTLFICANYVFVDYYFVSIDYKIFISSKCCDDLTA